MADVLADDTDATAAGPKAWQSGTAMARPFIHRLSQLADHVSSHEEHDGGADGAVTVAVTQVRAILRSARGVLVAVDANARSLHDAYRRSAAPTGDEARWALSAARGFDDLSALYLLREAGVADMASRADTPSGAAEALRAAIDLYAEFLERLDLAKADLERVSGGTRLH